MLPPVHEKLATIDVIQRNDAEPDLERVALIEAAVVVERAETLDDIDAAFRIERIVFEESGYGHMPQELDAQSTFYLAKSVATGEPIGCLRMIAGAPEPLPMMAMPLSGEWIERLARVAPHQLCEYGAMAVPSYVHADLGFTVAKALFREGYIHTLAEGIEWSGLVMEPRRARALARWNGLLFEQAGPTTFYMGGDVATFVASPRALYDSTIQLNPGFAAYVLKKLNPADYPILRGLIENSADTSLIPSSGF